MATMTR